MEAERIIRWFDEEGEHEVTQYFDEDEGWFVELFDGEFVDYLTFVEENIPGPFTSCPIE